MRFSSVLAAALLVAPMPAFAQETQAAEFAERLSDPDFQQGVAGAVSAMMGALLDIKMAPLSEAMAKMEGKQAPEMDPDATLGDIAGPDANRIPGEMAEKLPHMMGAMAGMAEQMEVILPVLRQVAEGMADDLAKGMAGTSLN